MASTSVPTSDNVVHSACIANDVQDDHHQNVQTDRESKLMSASCHALLEPSCFQSSSRNNSTSTASLSSSCCSSTKNHLRVQSTHTSRSTTTISRRGSTGTNNSARRGGLARHKRHSWMRSSVVRRAATVVDEQVAALCEKSPFLNSVACTSSSSTLTLPVQNIEESGTSTNGYSNNRFALFRRTEVQLGKALGRGGFAEVYAVDRFEIHDDEDNNAGGDDNNEVQHRQSFCHRRHMQATVTTASGRPAYAIKFLRKKLLSNTREFQHAAIDLAVEAQYLAALQDSPYIVRVHGLTRGGTAAFRSGKHDDFFIIMDLLAETLDRRIQRWQKRHLNATATANNNGAREVLDATNSMHTTEHTTCSTAATMTSSPPREYHARTLKYAHQIADALSYLHEKQIVYRDLKPQNLGFRERDVIQIFDFGLCRELPKPKGQSHRDESLEDEETFHMSGVGTQRYMAPEILTTRRYNLKADVFSWAMVALEMMTWTKPFAEFDPEEHQLNVAQCGERPRLITTMPAVNATKSECEPHSFKEEANGVDAPSREGNGEHNKTDSQRNTRMKKPTTTRKTANAVLVQDWPIGMANLLQESWTQDVGDRLAIQSVLNRMKSIVTSFNDNNTSTGAQEESTGCERILGEDTSQDSQTLNVTKISTDDDNLNAHMQEEVVVEFPSLFSPIHAMSGRRRKEQYERQQDCPAAMTRDYSDRWFGDRQSDASNSNSLELTMTSASTTLHDSNSTS